MSSSDSDSDTDFFTPGPEALLPLRCSLARFSLERASLRLQNAYSAATSFDRTATLLARRSYYNSLRSVSLAGSQTISNRYVSSLSYNHKTDTLAAASWDGSVYLLDPHSLNIHSTHTPEHIQQISNVICFGDDDTLITAGHDGFIQINNTNNNTTVQTPSNDRIHSLALHPNESLLFAASADYTWHFIDLKTSQTLYSQEGHTGPVTAISAHPDGSLLASGSKDTSLLIWDLRSGLNIASFADPSNGHTGAVHALAWRRNGYHFASAGADGQLLIWDLRAKSNIPLASVPAHSSLISSISFTDNDMGLLSAGYDGAVNITATDSWSHITKFQTLDKIMALVPINDNTFLTSGWDRSVKLYTQE